MRWKTSVASILNPLSSTTWRSFPTASADHSLVKVLCATVKIHAMWVSRNLTLTGALHSVRIKLERSAPSFSHIFKNNSAVLLADGRQWRTVSPKIKLNAMLYSSNSLIDSSARLEMSLYTVSMSHKLKSWFRISWKNSWMCFSKQIDALESLLDASLSSSICSASFDCSRAENSYKDTY